MNIPCWIWLLALVLAGGYAIPYTLLAGVEAWTGSLLFWTLFGVAVWAILIAAVARWRVEHGPEEGR